jgi:hypothetical protein
VCEREGEKGARLGEGGVGKRGRERREVAEREGEKEVVIQLQN